MSTDLQGVLFCTENSGYKNKKAVLETISNIRQTLADEMRPSREMAIVMERLDEAYMWLEKIPIMDFEGICQDKSSEGPAK